MLRYHAYVFGLMHVGLVAFPACSPHSHSQNSENALMLFMRGGSALPHPSTQSYNHSLDRAQPLRRSAKLTLDGDCHDEVERRRDAAPRADPADRLSHTGHAVRAESGSVNRRKAPIGTL